MTKAGEELLDDALASDNGRKGQSGILPAQEIRRLVRDHDLWARAEIRPEQIQPASLDLRLGEEAYRIPASFLPGPHSQVRDKLNEFAMHRMSLRDGAVLETGCVYLVPLQEQLALKPRVSAAANPKSSTGRLDVFTRMICDCSDEFDQVPAGYQGELFAEISPRTFSILVRSGSRLNQLRFRRGQFSYSDRDLRKLHESEQLVSGAADISNGLAVHVNLSGAASVAADAHLAGYRAKRHAGLIDIERVGAYDVLDFWEPIRLPRTPRIILEPDAFYILASKEAVHVPPDYAAEMVPFNPLVGEFRVHYAGFFDPGFGHDGAGGKGARAVLEVRSHEVPFILEDGQIVGRLIYEKLSERPDMLYGQGIGSNYQRQGLKLSKHFKPIGRL
jgi:dCTP deaminase